MSLDSQYKIKASFSGIENVVGGMKRIEQQIRANTAALREQMKVSAQTGRAGVQQRQSQQGLQQQAQGSRQVTNQLRQQHTATHRLLETNARMFEFGRQMRYVWREQADSLRQYTEEAMKLSQAQSKFKAIGLDPEANEVAFQAVRRTVSEIKGLTLTGATETLTDLHTALGDLGHAIEALPSASKFRVGFQTLFGERFSPEQLEQQIQNAFKYLEVTGAVAKGRDEIDRRFNVIAQMMASTGGRVRPSELLTMARRGGPALQGLSIAGLRNLSGPIQELSGTGVGTSLMSLYQAIIGGVMKQSAAAEFQRLGLLDPKKIEYGRAQKIKRLQPGANKLGALLMEDPLKAADALMEAMKRPLRGAPIDTTNANKVREEIAILFGNRTAQRLMSILTTQRGQVIKEAKLSEGAKTIQQIYDQILETPAGKIKVFEAAIENLKAEVGGPLLSAVAGAARALTPFIKLMAEHPNIFLTALAVSKLATSFSALAAVAQTTGILKLFAGAGAGRAALGAAGVGAEAAGAAGAGAGALGAGAGAGAGAAAAGGLRGLLARIPKGAAVAVIISELWGEIFNSSLSDIDQLDAQVAKLREARDKIRDERFKMMRETGMSTKEAAGQQAAVEEALGRAAAQYPMFKEPVGYLGLRSSNQQEQAKTDKATVEMLRGRKMGSLTEVTGFLQGLKDLQLPAGSRAAQLREDIQRLATAAWPQFAKELSDVTSEAPQAASALGQVTDQLKKLGLFTLSTPSSLGDSAHARTTRRLRTWVPPVQWGVPGHGEGGITIAPHLAMVGERGPEMIAPLSKLGDILEKAQARGSGQSGHRFSFQIDARGAQAGVGAEIKRAIVEAIQQLGLRDLTDDGFRDRALSI
jgi:hypothetical protein